MNRLKKMYFRLLLTALAVTALSCQPATESPQKTKKSSFQLSEEFKKYWFDGQAEVASYALTQIRYNEERAGNAVLIFVKEPFLKKEQVKANSATDKTVDVLKLNSTKKFNTGIYPYSIMQSTFSPLRIDAHAIKVTASTQEWCGQTYMQLNNRDKYEITSHSYFEGEADQKLSLEKAPLENEIWSNLRIAPRQVKLGQQNIIPDFSFLRLKHKPIKAYEAKISQENKKDTLVTTIVYSELQRVLNIYQSDTFPFRILKWEEKASNDDKNFTQAVLQKSIRIDYWNKNSNKFAFLRDSLQLK